MGNIASTFSKTASNPRQSHHICSSRKSWTSPWRIPFSLFTWYLARAHADSASWVCTPVTGSTKLFWWTTILCMVTFARTDEGFCTGPSRRCVPLTQAGGPFAEYWTMFGGLFFSQLGSSRDKGCVPWRSRQIPTLHCWPYALFGTITSKCFKTEIESCPYVHQKKVKFLFHMCDIKHHPGR